MPGNDKFNSLCLCWEITDMEYRWSTSEFRQEMNCKVFNTLSLWILYKLMVGNTENDERPKEVVPG